MSTRKVVYYGFLTSFGIILPLIFHFAIPFTILDKTLGQWLLPIHYAAFFGGLFFGPIAGLIVGGMTPMLSYLVTGMPSPPLVWFMIGEIAVYGLISGLLYHKLKFNIYVSMIISMIFGRISLLLQVYYIGGLILGKSLMFKSVLELITFGVAGEALQLLIIPIIIKRIQTTDYIKW